ncbi:MAG TPA: YdcH family protein [Pseudomonadales bacterium]|jgi:hypothetical protein
MNDDNHDTPSLAEQLHDLEQRHRLLDIRVDELQACPYQDRIELQRLKKQKLRLKDAIARLRSMLIPNLDA